MAMDAYYDYRLLQNIAVLLDAGDRQVLREFNLNPMQYSALLLLGSEEGWRLTDLSERLLCERSTVTRIVDFLESEGLVNRLPDPEDRRSQRVALTPAGTALYEQAFAAHNRSLHQRFSALSEEEQQQLHLLHQKLFEGLLAKIEHATTEF